MNGAMSLDAPPPDTDDQDRPRVIARPPLIYLAFLAAGLGLGYGWPAPFVADAARYPLSGTLCALGVALAVFAFRRFRRAGTNVQTWKASTALVAEGPFRFSRNPIYVALTLIYCGIGVAADSGWVLGLAVPLLAVMRYGVIAPEERYLEAKFGDAYRDYKGRVRRWL